MLAQQRRQEGAAPLAAASTTWRSRRAPDTVRLYSPSMQAMTRACRLGGIGLPPAEKPATYEAFAASKSARLGMVCSIRISARCGCLMLDR